MSRGAVPIAAASVLLIGAGSTLAVLPAAASSAANPAVRSASSPAPSATLVVAVPVDPAEAVLLPVEDVVGRSEKLIFGRASADGAVVDRGGREFVLASDVLFAFNQATLTARARAEIRRIATALKSSTSVDAEPLAKVSAVTVSGYTDDVGGSAYNLGLSRRRALAVRAELLRALGSTIRVTAVGRGEQDPVATNSTRRGRQANRRVEIRGR